MQDKWRRTVAYPPAVLLRRRGSAAMSATGVPPSDLPVPALPSGRTSDAATQTNPTHDADASSYDDASSSSFSLPPPPSTSALLLRLADLQSRPHMHSSRTRRASVAIILRVRHPSDAPWPALIPPLPKVPKRTKRKAATAAATSATPAAGPLEDGPSVVTETNAPAAAATAASYAQVQSPDTAPKLASAAPASPPPDADTLTRQPSSLPPAAIAHTHARIASLSSDAWVAESELEVLFMQRAQNLTDRWSGQMSFPGGRQEKGESDEQTAVREVQEEIGWDLSDRSGLEHQTHSRFVRVGQLDDKAMDGLKNVKPLAVSVFVYLQLSRTSPPLRLQPSEVSAVLFVPLSYFQSLRRGHDFGRIYHPLMLQVLQPRQPPATSASAAASPTTTAAATPPKVFQLRLIGFPHRQEGRLLKEAAAEVLDAEHAQTLQRLEATHEHFSDIDEAPFVPPSKPLQQLRSRLRALAHELPLPTISLPNFLPSLEQLASLRFPALSLPGAWVSARGHGGISTQNDMRTLVHNLLAPDAPSQRHGHAAADAEAASSSSTATGFSSTVATAAATGDVAPTVNSPSLCPPPFILWGLTLERTGDLLMFLGYPFMFDFFHRGIDRRKRLYAWWSNAGEARWNVERQVDALLARRSHSASASGSKEQSDTTQSSAPPQAASAPSPAQSATAAPSSPAPSDLSASPYSTPLLLSRAREALHPLTQRARDAWQRQKQRLQSKL